MPYDPNIQASAYSWHSMNTFQIALRTVPLYHKKRDGVNLL